MRISKNHNSLGCEQPLGLNVNQLPDAQYVCINRGDVFLLGFHWLLLLLTAKHTLQSLLCITHINLELSAYMYLTFLNKLTFTFLRATSIWQVFSMENALLPTQMGYVQMYR